MESIYAALLLHKASKDISEDAIEKILKAAGASIDKSQITKLVAGLKEANIDTILASAAAAPVIAAAPSTAAGSPGKEEAKEEGKKKKKKEEETEVEPTGIGSLF
jgi:large subunit ribosomal protein L12